MFVVRSCTRQSSVCAASALRSAVSRALLDCRDMRDGDDVEEFSRARVCAASRILTSVASFFWRAPTREFRTVCSYRKEQVRAKTSCLLGVARLREDGHGHHRFRKGASLGTNVP